MVLRQPSKEAQSSNQPSVSDHPYVWLSFCELAMMGPEATLTLATPSVCVV